MWLLEATEYVDWVGLNFYEKDWDEDNLVPSDMFTANIRNGQDNINFYETFAVGKNKPMIIAEIATFDPNKDPTPPGSRTPLSLEEQKVFKNAWFSQIYNVSLLKNEFPRIKAISYFHVEKEENIETQEHVFGPINIDYRVPEEGVYKTLIADSYFLSPSGIEVCDGWDNNCDGVVDEDCPCVIAIEEITTVGQDAVVPIDVVDIPVDIAQFSLDVLYDQNVTQYQIGSQQWGDCMASLPAWGVRDVSLITPGHLRIEGTDDGNNPISHGSSCNMVNLSFATTATDLSCDMITLSSPTGAMANWSESLFCSAEVCFNACIIGDVDQNQNIDIDDVFCLFKYIMGRPSCLDGLDLSIFTCANIDKNGGIDIDDVFCLFKYIMGRPSCMGVRPE